MQPRPPERIDLGEVVLRRYSPDDAPALAQAAAASIDELAPWMPWATPEGVTAEAMAAFIAETTGRAAEGTEAVYGLFDLVDDRCLGGCGLHDRLSPGGIELGYWLATEATGRGLMTRVVGTLTELALGMDDIGWVEVHCDEANHRSAGVPRRLGFALARTMDAERLAPADTGRQLIWVRTDPIGPDVGERTPRR